ncbi:MAG: tetratricopeptide repeat protein [Nitrospinales bacterium]
MPAKIKWVWAICCWIIFFGFIFLSITTQIDEAKNKREQTQASRKAKPSQNAEKLRKKTFQAAGKIKDIKEFIALGQNEKAEQLAREVLQSDPNNSLAYTWWGISLVKTNHLNEAIEKFRRASQLEHTHPKTFLYWGLTLGIQEKHEEAIEKFRTAVQLDPKNSSAFAYWGGSLAGLGKYKDAIAQLERALEINPFNEIAYGVLVDSFYHTQQYANAWKTVLEARKKNVPIAGKSLERLRGAMPEPAS